MTKEELRDKAIEKTTTTNSKGSFDYSLVGKLILFLICPLGILSVLLNRLNIRHISKINHNDSLNEKTKLQKKIFLLVFDGIIGIAILTIAIVFLASIHQWWSYLIGYLSLGFSTSWIIISLYHIRGNKRVHKITLRDEAVMSAALDKQEVPFIKKRPYIDFLAFVLSYSYWDKLENKIVDKKTKQVVGWKHGIVVNKDDGIMVPISVWNRHFIFAGKTGYGKTYNILLLCFAAAYNQFPTCVIDGKADPKLEDTLKRIAKLFNMPITVWSLKNHKVKYNPFKHKTRIELIDMISEMFDYSARKRNAMTGLYAGFTRQWITAIVDFLFAITDNTENAVTFELLAKYTKPGALIEDLSERNFKKQNDFDKNELIERINGYDENQLKIIHNEVFEMYVNTKEVIGADGISVKDFMRASKRGQILLFQVENNITNSNLSSILFYDWNILQNFNEEERAVDHKKTVLAIDESPSLFKSAEHPSEMFRKFRSKEICIAVGLQEKASIEKDGKAGLLDTLVNNATTYFISRLSDEATIKTISSIYGTEKNVESTIRSVIGENQETTSSGDSSLRVGEKFIWHPNKIRMLSIGHAMLGTAVKKTKNDLKHPAKTVEFEEDAIYTDIAVDNVMETIQSFEEKKKAKYGDSTKQNLFNIDPIILNLIHKIETMSEEAYLAYRKDEWYRQEQKERKEHREMPESFLIDMKAHIHELQMR